MAGRRKKSPSMSPKERSKHTKYHCRKSSHKLHKKSPRGAHCTSAWIELVKAVHAKMGKSYSEALSAAAKVNKQYAAEAGKTAEGKVSVNRALIEKYAAMA